MEESAFLSQSAGKDNIPLFIFASVKKNTVHYSLAKTERVNFSFVKSAELTCNRFGSTQ